MERDPAYLERQHQPLAQRIIGTVPFYRIDSAAGRLSRNALRPCQNRNSARIFRVPPELSWPPIGIMILRSQLVISKTGTPCSLRCRNDVSHQPCLWTGESSSSATKR